MTFRTTSVMTMFVLLGLTVSPAVAGIFLMKQRCTMFTGVSRRPYRVLSMRFISAHTFRAMAVNAANRDRE